MDVTADGEWIELSHPIDPDVVKVGFLPRPEMDVIPDASLRATRVDIATHVGTHLEAPCHVIEDGKSIDEYLPDRWITTGVVREVDADALEVIGIEQLRPPPGIDLEPGDALLIRTGWEDHVGTDRYHDQPYLSEEAAAWIVDQGVSWVGVDTPSPEKPATEREGAFDYPVHTTLLEHDVPIAEHLTNLAPVADAEVDVIALPLRYMGSDGSQARIVARRR